MQRLGLQLASTAVALLCGTSAFAQAEVCVDPNTHQVDGGATQTWQAMTQRSDASVMAQLAGTWYIETQNSYTGQVDHQYQQYSPDGFFNYQDRVCDGSGACNDYAGQGNYAVIGLPDGSLQLMTIVSDLNRDRQCTGTAARFMDADTVQFSTGGMLRRVR